MILTLTKWYHQIKSMPNTVLGTCCIHTQNTRVICPTEAPTSPSHSLEGVAEILNTLKNFISPQSKHYLNKEIKSEQMRLMHLSLYGCLNRN